MIAATAAPPNRLINLNLIMPCYCVLLRSGFIHLHFLLTCSCAILIVCCANTPLNVRVFFFHSMDVCQHLRMDVIRRFNYRKLLATFSVPREDSDCQRLNDETRFLCGTLTHFILFRFIFRRNFGVSDFQYWNMLLIITKEWSRKKDTNSRRVIAVYTRRELSFSNRAGLYLTCLQRNVSKFLTAVYWVFFSLCRGGPAIYRYSCSVKSHL